MVIYEIAPSHKLFFLKSFRSLYWGIFLWDHILWDTVLWHCFFLKTEIVFGGHFMGTFFFVPNSGMTFSRVDWV